MGQNATLNAVFENTNTMTYMYYRCKRHDKIRPESDYVPQLERIAFSVILQYLPMSNLPRHLKSFNLYSDTVKP